PRIEAGKVRLRDLLKPRQTVIAYIYDFGADWEHRLTVTPARVEQSGVSYPRYLCGRLTGTPADCSGLTYCFAIPAALAQTGYAHVLLLPISFLQLQVLPVHSLLSSLN